MAGFGLEPQLNVSQPLCSLLYSERQDSKTRQRASRIAVCRTIRIVLQSDGVINTSISYRNGGAQVQLVYNIPKSTMNFYEKYSVCLGKVSFRLLVLLYHPNLCKPEDPSFEKDSEHSIEFRSLHVYPCVKPFGLLHDSPPYQHAHKQPMLSGHKSLQ